MNDYISKSGQGAGINLLSLTRSHPRNLSVKINTCALDSLLIVMHHWGSPVTKAMLVQKLPVQEDHGYSLGSLQTAAKQLGYEAFVLSSTAEELQYHTNKGRPCIIVYRIKDGVNHAVIVWSMREEVMPNGNNQFLYIQETSKPSLNWIKAETVFPQWEALNCPLLLVAKVSE